MTKKLIIAIAVVFVLATVSFAATKAMEIVAKMDPEIKVSLDGKILDLKSPDGQDVNVVIYNGTTYLPVRAFSNALGLQVDWDSKNKTVVLKSGADDFANKVNPSAKTVIGDIVFQNDKVAVKYAGMEAETDDNDVEIKFIVENLTREAYHLTVIDTKVNARAIPSKLHDREDIGGLENEDVEVEFKKSELKKAGVDKLENLEFKFKFHHLTAPFETSVVKVNF